MRGISQSDQLKDDMVCFMSQSHEVIMALPDMMNTIRGVGLASLGLLGIVGAGALYSYRANHRDQQSEVPAIIDEPDRALPSAPLTVWPVPPPYALPPAQSGGSVYGREMTRQINPGLYRTDPTNHA
jgi:hypothetical protein